MPVAASPRKEAKAAPAGARPSRRTALVTGASRGIGRAVALALAEAGYDVAVAARDASRLIDVQGEIVARGARAFGVAVEVTDPVSVEAGVLAVTAALAPPTVLVNNAGIASSHRFAEIPPEEWARTLAVNATGPFLLTRACLPAMLAAGWGRIVNVASTAAVQGFPYTAHYTASKHAVLGMTRALALEVAAAGVTANCVCPGFVDTAMTERSIATIVERTGRTREEARRSLEAASAQRRFITPEEVAAAVVYLTTDAARGVNGQAIVLNG
jgi:NAD(P)-dependent dehydrogenase (short-subunit alcohol dehydrogenase family)